MKFNKIFIALVLPFLLPATLLGQPLPTSYPTQQQRKLSPGKTTYYIDPQLGSDSNTGLEDKRPWKTFIKINQLILSPGDRVEIIKSGVFKESLVLVARGSLKLPVKIRFVPGRYDMFPANALKKQLHITNTNDHPYQQKSIALMFDSCQFTSLEGDNSNFIMRGKMIEAYVNNCTDIKIQGVNFDYQRPTVSELKVVNKGVDYVDLQIHKDSQFSIRDSLLIWQGEGWSAKPGSLWQILNINTKDLQRLKIPMKSIRFVQTGEYNVRAYLANSLQKRYFEKGYIYQNRNTERDCAGVFLKGSKNIQLKNIRINFMHGLGIVGQYCENIKVDNLIVKPADSSGRTCAAWADILHFAGCNGMIEVGNSTLTAANDDAINVHGIHLKIKQIIAQNKILVEFMHNQTYGFNPYSNGDSIDVIRPESLLTVGNNMVMDSKMISDKQIILTLKNPVQSDIYANAAVENITATPEVYIHNNNFSRIPTRGILTTTRRKIIIEDNNFDSIHMTGILVSDDASDWYESGMVKDMTIRRNHFTNCGAPVISIWPENTKAETRFVHNNIVITQNIFDIQESKLLSVKSTSNIKLTNNIINTTIPRYKIEDLIELKDCAQIQLSNNKLQYKPGN